MNIAITEYIDYAPGEQQEIILNIQIALSNRPK